MPRRLSMLAVAGLIVSAVALVACSGSQGQSGNTGSTTTERTIVLQNLSFAPSSLTVKPGETIRINNADTVEHHIMIGTTDLGIQQPGRSRSWTAPQTNGKYIMKCLIHPTMLGDIKVGSGGSTIGTMPAGGGGGTGGSGGTGSGGGTGY